MQSNPLKFLVPVLIILASAAAAQPETGRYLLYVDGLACPFCAYGIEKQLKRIDGIESLSTDVKKGRVVIEMEDGRRLDRARVETAVTDAGFTLNRFEAAGADPEK